MKNKFEEALEKLIEKFTFVVDTKEQEELKALKDIVLNGFKENQELRNNCKTLEISDILPKIFELGCEIQTIKLQEENEKLKKAIEILKEKPYVLVFGLENFEWNEYYQLYIYEEEYEDTIREYNFMLEEWQEYGSVETIEHELTKEEYKLLKEILRIKLWT